jgi:hypothetical protein
VRRFAWLAVVALGWSASAGGGWVAADEAPIFRVPLFVGQPPREEPGGHVLIAARGPVLWVAAQEGLRRYDLEQKTLSRPAGTPAGRATAVVAAAREIWAAVEGRLYRSKDGRTFQLGESRVWKEISYLAVDGGDLWLVADGTLYRRATDGRLAAIDLHRPGTFGEVVAVASAANGVCWGSLYWSGGADAGARPASRGTALVRIRGEKVDLFRHPEPGEFLAPQALIAQADGSVLVGFVDGRGTPVADRYFHRFDGKTWTPIGGWAVPYRRQPDSSRQFIPNTGAPIGWEVAAGSGDGRFWIAAQQRTLMVIPADPARAQLTYPAEAGELLGVTDTPLGLVVLGDRRLARWHDGRWTLFTAPDANGLSREKTAPTRPGFYPATGMVLGPGSGEKSVAVASRPARAWSPMGAIDGVPLFGGMRPMWMDALRGGLHEDLTDYLPDLDKRDRIRFAGLGGGQMLSADDSEAPAVLLTRPVPKDAGLLLSVEAAPVFQPGRPPAEGSLRFQPLRIAARVKNGRPLLAAAARFQRKNVAALNEAIVQGRAPKLRPALEHPTLIYDGQRDRLMVYTFVEEARVLTELCYIFKPERPTEIESLLGFVMEHFE